LFVFPIHQLRLDFVVDSRVTATGQNEVEGGRFLGTVQDVTEYKHLEEKFRRAQMSFPLSKDPLCRFGALLAGTESTRARAA